jgi:adenosine deaminase
MCKDVLGMDDLTIARWAKTAFESYGVLARDDAEAVRILRERDVVLDVGITFNFLLNVVEKREDNPIKYFLNHGVKCPINSDDLLLFGCNILPEYQLGRDVMGKKDLTIVQCARTSNT